MNTGLLTRVTNEPLQLPRTLWREAVAVQRLCPALVQCHDCRLSSSLLLLHEDDAFEIQNVSEGKGLSSPTC